MGNGISLDVNSFEEKLGLEKGFSFALISENDWSFIIKLSALVEAACTHSLVVKFGYPEIEESLAYLEQSNNRAGRIALLRKIDAIYDNQAKTLEQLSILRNKVAHDVKSVNFRFKNYLEKCDEAQRRKFIQNFGNSVAKQEVFFGETYSRDEFVLAHPKLAVWASISEVVACLYLEVESVNISTLKNPLLATLT
jgi:hypothetical protein